MTATETVEIELKFDVDAGTEAPDLSNIVESGQTGAPRTFHLEAVYFDTADLDLLRSKIVLRRRTGGTDFGWHLKRPADSGLGRRELQVDFGQAPADGPIPTAILEQVHAIIREKELSPIATVVTERTMTSVYGDSRAEIAVFCADEVRAVSLLPGGDDSGIREWCEWEFELTGSGSPDLLEPARDALLAAGARTASSESKLARALGPQVGARMAAEREAKAARRQPSGRGRNAGGDSPQNGSGTKGSDKKGKAKKGKKGKKGKGSTPKNGRTPRESALDLVVDATAGYTDLLLTYDPLVRADAPDSVHQMRVNARSLRSLLKSFPGVLDDAQITDLEDDLKELGEILGLARDSEVQHAAISALLETEDAPQDLLGMLERRQQIDYDRALRTIRHALATPRYLSLLDRLDEVVETPRPGPDAGLTAKKEAVKAIKRARKRIVKAERAMGELGEWTPEWEEAAHTVRKRAKALRYTCESSAHLDDDFAALGKRAKRVQSLLGDFNDTVINRGRIAELADLPEARTLSPQAHFVFGRLDAREQQRGREAVEAYLALPRF